MYNLGRTAADGPAPRVRADVIILAMVKQTIARSWIFRKKLSQKTAYNILAIGAAMLSVDEPAPRRRPRRGSGRAAPAYSAGVADTASAGIVTGSASRRNRRQAMRMSRNNLTQALGVRKWDSNSRFVSSGTQ